VPTSFSKVIVLSLIAVMQSALITLVGLAGQKVPVQRGSDTGDGADRDLRRRSRGAVDDVHC